MKNPKLTIITASFNQGEFIEECIKSIKNQTYPYIEHIIMDGGSTDSTVDIIKKYAGTYNLKWKSEKDRGQSHAFNKAINMAEGDWLLFINSDDFLLNKTAIEDAFKLIEKKTNYMIYMASINVVDEKGKFRHHGSPFKQEVFTHDSLMNKKAPVVHQGTFYNKRVFKVAGCYNEKFYYHMDYEFHLRASKYFEICTLNMYLSALRAHPRAKTQRGNAFGILELLNARLKNGGPLFHKETFLILKKFLYYLIFPMWVKKRVKRFLVW